MAQEKMVSVELTGNCQFHGEEKTAGDKVLVDEATARWLEDNRAGKRMKVAPLPAARETV